MIAADSIFPRAEGKTGLRSHFYFKLRRLRTKASGNRITAQSLNVAPFWLRLQQEQPISCRQPLEGEPYLATAAYTITTRGY